MSLYQDDNVTIKADIISIDDSKHTFTYTYTYNGKKYGPLEGNTDDLDKGSYYVHITPTYPSYLIGDFFLIIIRPFILFFIALFFLISYLYR
jgi:hypothetical protein